MISDTIKDLRRRNFLNQTAFANRIGVTQGTVSQWENGLTSPNSEQLRSISTNFDISIDELLRGENEKDISEEAPKTYEARLLAKGVDKMPLEQRQAIVNMLIGLRPDIFKKGNENDDT